MRELEESNATIRVLLLEDNPDDVVLIKRELKKSSFKFSFKEIESKVQLKAESLDGFDLVLCDYGLKGYDGLSALKYINSLTEIPIIIVSGSIGDELCCDLLSSGADDFVNKSNLKKLPFVIKNVLANKRYKKISEDCQKKYQETSQMFDTIFEGLENPVFIKDGDRKYVRVNAAFIKLYERSESELIGKTDDEIGWIHHNIQSYQDDLNILNRGISSQYEMDYFNDAGQRVWLEVTKNPIFIDGAITGILGQAKNVTARKDAISTMERSQHILQQAEELTLSGSFEYDVELDLVSCSKNLVKMLGIHSNQISLGRLIRLIKAEDRTMFLDGINQSIEKKKEYRMEHRYMINEKNQGYFEILFRPDYKDGTGNTFYGTILDVTRESRESRSRIAHQEESTNEIARELHDNLGQKLNAVSMYLSKASNCGDCSEIIEKSTDLLHEGLDDLGRLLSNISVKHIDDISLNYALEKLTSYLPVEMDLTFNCEIDESRIDRFVKQQIFRVVQETVNNAIKYSNAQNLNISLQHEGSILSMIVEDDGNGFELESNELGNGLMNITHRVKKSNGLIDINSKKGQGTKVVVKMPVS
ncbi:PAS domain S-box protein [Ekhidna sp.]|uniref:PAS domain S-box protein n=1 Tax=Ekhidna sp. TaxID=2608089 RepID=UPI003CCBC3E5